MASANVELVRSFGAAWERRDFPRMAELVDPEMELVMADGPDPGTQIGFERLQRIWREYLTTWEDYRLVEDEIRELDGERVLALFRFGGRGKTSGVDLAELSSLAAGVYHIRQRKIVRLVRYWDADRALAHLGLAPRQPSS